MLLDQYTTILQTCLPSPACKSRKGLRSLNTEVYRQEGRGKGGRTRWECSGNHKSQEGREAGPRLHRNELIQMSTCDPPPSPAPF